MNSLGTFNILITVDDYVLRYINYSDQRIFETDGRISKLIFYDRYYQPSVHLERLVNLRQIYPKLTKIECLRLNVGKIEKDNTEKVIYQPLDENYSHCVIINHKIESGTMNNSELRKEKSAMASKLLQISIEKYELTEGGQIKISPYDPKS